MTTRRTVLAGGAAMSLAAARDGETADLLSGLRNRIAAVLGSERIETGFALAEIESGRGFGLDERAVFPTASVFKTPLMLEVYRQAGAGALKLDERLPLLEQHKTLDSGVLQTLGAGLTPTIRDLCMLMTIVSDNTATNMLLERVGRERLNALYAELGLTDTAFALDVHQMFLHAWGLPTDGSTPLSTVQQVSLTRPMDYGSLTFARTKANTVSTAADMVALLQKIGRLEVVSGPAMLDMLSIMGRQQYKNRVPQTLPWGAVYNKTGSMRGLRNDVGVIRRRPDLHLAYALFSFDPTPLPGGNSELLVARDAAVNGMMAKVGRLIWDAYGDAG